jgi:hypothetical protein
MQKRAPKGSIGMSMRLPLPTEMLEAMLASLKAKETRVGFIRTAIANEIERRRIEAHVEAAE